MTRVTVLTGVVVVDDDDDLGLSKKLQGCVEVDVMTLMVGQ